MANDLINNKPRIIVAHVLQQHSFRTAYAVQKAGFLDHFYTSVYYNPNKILSKIFLYLLPSKYRVKYRKHYSESINEKVLVSNSLLGYLFLMVSKIDSKGFLTCKILDNLLLHFNSSVVKKAIKRRVDGIILYDTGAYWGFCRFGRNNKEIVKFIDHSTVPLDYMYSVVKNDKRRDVFYKTYEINYGLFNDTKREISKKEVLSSDYHIVASSFSKNVLMSMGIDSSRIIMAPYGVNKKEFYPKKHRDKNESLEVLFVGQLIEMKGIRELLFAAKRLYNKGINFTIIGSGSQYNKEIIDGFEFCASFIGRVESAKEMNDFYNKADVFVFPTKCEGFGFVIIEALSAGCPVITTKYCIGGDVIIDGFNGFLLEEINENEVIKKLKWCKENRDALHSMRKNAQESSMDYTWDNYNKKIAEGLSQALGYKDVNG